MAEQEEIILKVGVEGNETLLAGLEQTTEAVNELKRQKKALNEEAKKLDKTYEQLAQEQKALNKGVQNLNKDLKKGNITQETYNKRLQDLKNQSQGVTARMNELGAQQTKLAQKQTQLTLETKETSFAYQQQERAILQNNRAQQAADGSLAQLRIKLAQAKKAWTELSAEERNNAKVGGELLKVQQQLDKEVRDLEKQIGVTSRNVGNYGDALNAATPFMGAFGSQVSMVLSSLQQLKTVLAGVTASQNANTTATAAGASATKGANLATRGFNKALKLLKVALISTGIGAIVVALGSLVAAIATTQRGTDALSKALTPLKEIFATLFGLLQDVGLKIFDRLKVAIESPRQALIDLGKAIINNVVNRFKGSLELVKATAKGFVATFKLMGLEIKQALANVPILGAGIDQEALKKDLAAAKKQTIDAAKDAASAVIQIGSGLDKQQQKALIEGTKQLTEEGKKRAAEAIKRGKEIAAVEIEIETAAINLNKERSRALRIFEEQKEIAQNVLKSDKERIDAANEAKRQLQIAADLEQDQLQRQIKLAKLKAEANDTDREAFKEIADLEGQLEAVQAQNIKKRILLNNTANTVIKQRIAINKKAAAEQEKQLAKLEAARDKATENEKRRQFETQQEILDNKAQTLQLEADLEAATTEQTEAQKIQSAIALEKELAAIRIKGLENQATEAERQEKMLADKIKELRTKSKGEETVEIINLEDQLKEKQLEVESLKGEQMAQVKLQNQVNEQNLLAEQRALNDEVELEREKERQENIKLVKETAINAVDTLQQSAFNRQKERINQDKQREIEALQAKKEAGVISQEEFEKERVAIDRKAFERQKRTDTSSALINGALAITKTFAQLGFTPAAAAAVVAGGITTATQVAAIQARQFAEGGFTGTSTAPKDSSGHRPVGIVHENEYVTPKRVLETSEGAYHVAALERLRLGQPSQEALRGFANGGFTSQSVSVDLNNEGLANVISNAIDTRMQSIRVVNVATDTATQANRDIQIKNQATF